MGNNPEYIGKDEVREQLVQSARQVFARYGFKKTALDDIAREAHKGKSTIYYYFKSKDEIFKAVIEAEAEIRAKSIQCSDCSDRRPETKTENLYLCEDAITKDGW